MTGANDDRHDEDALGREPLSRPARMPFNPASELEHDEQIAPQHAPLDTGRLDLAEPEERLPWLESADDSEWDEQAQARPSRLILFALGALALLAAIVGGLWWYTHRAAANTEVADGSVIPAPIGPYKEAPANPGGKTFDGTGDTSFAVSEGQTTAAQMAPGGDATPAAALPTAAPAAAPAAAPSTSASAKASTAASANADAAPASGSGVAVQVGAYSSQAAAEKGWQAIAGQAGGALSGVSHRVVSGSADIGTVYRLQAVAPNREAANALCGKLKARNLSCQVK